MTTKPKEPEKTKEPLTDTRYICYMCNGAGGEWFDACQNCQGNAEASVILYAYLMDHRTCPICQGTGDEWFESSIRCGTCHGEGSVKSNNSIPDDADDCA